MSRRLDENAGVLMRQLLILMYLRTASWEDTSNPIPLTEIKEAVRKVDCPLLIQYLDQYLRLIGTNISCKKCTCKLPKYFKEHCIILS